MIEPKSKEQIATSPVSAQAGENLLVTGKEMNANISPLTRLDLSVTNAAYEVVVNPANIALGFYPGLTIDGVAGYSYIIQSSTNLANTNAWITLTNLTLAEPLELYVDTNVDASSPFNPKTFYKVLPGQ
jgi:hypothetical protein